MLELAEITIDWISQECDVHIPSSNKHFITQYAKLPYKGDNNVKNKTADILGLLHI